MKTYNVLVTRSEGPWTGILQGDTFSSKTSFDYCRTTEGLQGDVLARNLSQANVRRIVLSDGNLSAAKQVLNRLQETDVNDESLRDILLNNQAGRKVREEVDLWF